MALQLRLTLIYSVLLVLALATTGIAGYLIAAHRIYASVDDSLRLRAQAVTEALEPLGTELNAADVESNRGELEDLASTDLVFQVRGADGAVLYSSAQPASGSLPPPVQASSGFLTQDVRGQSIRILYQPLVNGSARLATVEVGESLASANGALNEIRDIILIGSITAAILTSLSAYTLAGRTLRPVRKVAQVARDIEGTGDFSRRLDAPESSSEVTELVAAFNAMIERVENTLAHQKSFLADSSHELRRPLTVLRTNVDILAKHDLSPEERERCVSEIRAEAQLMSKLLADLLLLAREESQGFDRASVDLSRVCERAIARVTLGHRRRLTVEIEAGIEVLGDRERLEQMVDNLLENAVQYSPAEEKVRLSLHRSNGIARLAVSDSGPGIRANDLKHVFERFYRSEAARTSRPEGSGLGLSIVKYVAEAHGGTVSVTSGAEEGTRFLVDLPVAGSPR
ncbi:MAG TPA: ATP-binding protein [Dehalococcoidia bacterium]|nr:ATP-binding protein [Dehalococcoidia bacterium]